VLGYSFFLDLRAFRARRVFALWICYGEAMKIGSCDGKEHITRVEQRDMAYVHASYV